MPSSVTKPAGGNTPPPADPISPIIQQQLQQKEQQAKDLAESIESGGKGPKDIND